MATALSSSSGPFANDRPRSPRTRQCFRTRVVLLCLGRAVITNRALLLGVYVSVGAALTSSCWVLEDRFKVETGLLRSFQLSSDLETSPVSQRVSPNLDLSFLDDDPTLPTRNFRVDWQGSWYLKGDQEVDIYAGADDLVVVSIDDQVVLERNSATGFHTASRRIAMTAGLHRLSVRYEQYGGGFGLNVRWAPRGETPRRFAPGTLFPTPPTASQLETQHRLVTFRQWTVAAWIAPPLMFGLWLLRPYVVGVHRRRLWHWIHRKVQTGQDSLHRFWRERQCRSQDAGYLTGLQTPRPPEAHRSRGFGILSPFLARPAVFEACGVFLGFGALAALVTYPLLAEIEDALPNDLGDPMLNAWILAWDADRIRHGFSGLWDAPNFFPYPRSLTYSEHLLGIAVFSAPIQWISGNPILAYNAAVVLSYVLAGAGMYLLAGSVTGSRVAAVVAGVAFACLPYRVAQLAHLQVLMYAWMPIGLFALHRYFDSGSRVALSGFVAAFLLQGLSNSYFLYFFAVPVVIVVVAELVCGGRMRRRTVAELAVAAALMLVVLAPVAMAYFETHGEQGFVRSRDGMVQYSADVASYFQVSSKLLLWGDVLPTGRAEGELFPGFVLLALSAVGLAGGLSSAGRIVPGLSPRCRRAVRLYGVIGLLAFVLSLGPEPTAFGRVLLSSGPYDWLLAVVPGFGGLRVPARLAVVVYVALGVLASVGVTVVLRTIPPRAAFAACVLFAVAIVAEGYAGPMQMVSVEPKDDFGKNQAHAWLTTTPPGAVLELPIGRNSQSIGNNTRYQFATLQHGHPVVNGYSGYASPLFRLLAGASSPLLDLNHMSEFLRGVRSLGVRYIVVNAPDYGNGSEARATIRAMGLQRDQLVGMMEFDQTSVFWLVTSDDVPNPETDTLRELPVSGLDVTTSREGRRWVGAVDGNLDTRWTTGTRQTGDEWIEIRVDRSSDLGLLRMGLSAGASGDYPRGLLVESIEDHAVRELYRGGVMTQLFAGLVRSARRVEIDIPLPRNDTDVLRIRQTGRTQTQPWSIHELSLWTRDPG